MTAAHKDTTPLPGMTVARPATATVQSATEPHRFVWRLLRIAGIRARPQTVTGTSELTAATAARALAASSEPALKPIQPYQNRPVPMYTRMGA